MMEDILALATRLEGLQREYRTVFSQSLEARREADRLTVLVGDLTVQIQKMMARIDAAKAAEAERPEARGEVLPGATELAELLNKGET